MRCPDCDEPIPVTFHSTGGLGGQKRGLDYNTTPDTTHYVCFPCGKTWKQRLSGPLTPDVVGDIAFFTCRRSECGRSLTVTREGAAPTDIELTCAGGHRHSVRADGEGLRLEEA